MNPANRDLPVQASWDAGVSVNTMIEGADYALLRDNSVALIIDEPGEVLRAVSLALENGLHYDGDLSIEKAHAQKKIEEGEWGITREWSECEEHLQ